MQYETIILEMMTRIKKLEDECASLENRISELEIRDINDDSSNHDEDAPPASGRGRYTRVTDGMLERCYAYGKKAYEDESFNISEFADRVAIETGMKETSAYITIVGVKCLLSGTVYKRGLSVHGTNFFYKKIYADYGEQGLKHALEASRLHIDYLISCGVSVKGLEKLYRNAQAEYHIA